MVFNAIASSKNTFTGFLADKWKFDRKINRVHYAKLVSLNIGDFCPRRYYTYKESLASIN